MSTCFQIRTVAFFMRKSPEHFIHYGKSKEENKMKRMKSKWSVLLFAVTAVFIACPAVVLAAEEAPKPAVYATFWALVPPVVAIVLALITKEVYSSLFVGILVGALFYSGGNFEKTMTHIFEGGIIGVLSDSYNVGILVFLVIL